MPTLLQLSTCCGSFSSPNCSCSALPQLFASFIPSTFCGLWLFGRFVGYWREPNKRWVVPEHRSQTPQGYHGWTRAIRSNFSRTLPHYREGGRSPSGDRIHTLSGILSSAMRAEQWGRAWSTVHPQPSENLYHTKNVISSWQQAVLCSRFFIDIVKDQSISQQ